MKIYNIYAAEIYSSEKETIKQALEEAVKNRADLHMANLYRADLSGANLYMANLRGADLYMANLRGANLPIYCKWSVSIVDGKIKIGCKIKTIKEWDVWFKSEEIYSTERNSSEFIRIEANYKAAKAYLNHIKKHKP